MPQAGPFDTHAYWLMPHGLRAVMATVLWPAARGRSRKPAPARLPFPILAPGKIARGTAEHSFWRGSLWGRTVALQGDSSVAKYDLFELAGTRLLYWGTFRGNGYYGSEESHSFSSPFLWMERWMSLGDFRQGQVTDSLLDPRLRRVTGSAPQTLRVQIVSHYDTWRDPDSRVEYSDVLEVHYWGRYPEPGSREVYHLGNGLGTVRFESFNSREPSGVRLQFAESFEPFSPEASPALPWFDPFQNATHVRNGFCEDFLLPPTQGGAVATYLRGWSGSDGAVITTEGGDEGTGPWKIALRRSTGGAGSNADFAVATEWIPVTPGQRYRLSGSLWRASAADDVYLDFNDGVGLGGSFEDAQARATGAGSWERVAAEATVGPATTAVKVRCVRDGGNRGHAWCDGITLQRVG